MAWKMYSYPSIPFHAPWSPGSPPPPGYGAARWVVLRGTETRWVRFVNWVVADVSIAVPAGRVRRICCDSAHRVRAPKPAEIVVVVPGVGVVLAGAVGCAIAEVGRVFVGAVRRRIPGRLLLLLAPREIGDRPVGVASHAAQPVHRRQQPAAEVHARR